MAEKPGLDIEGLYKQYGGMVYRRCLQLLKNEELAREALHDVFVQLLRHERQLHAEAPSSLLFRIATHVCLNRLRTVQRRPEHPDEALLLRLASAEELEERSIARRSLDWLFDQEPVSTRTLAVLHLLDGMTLEEVAEICQLSVSGVRKRLRRLRERLIELEGAPS